MIHSLPQVQVGDFFTHNFVSKWQDKKLKECLFTFPKDVVLSEIDFAENCYF